MTTKHSDAEKFRSAFEVDDWDFDDFQITWNARKLIEDAVEGAVESAMESLTGQLRKLQVDAAAVGIAESVGKLEFEFGCNGDVVAHLGESWDHKVAIPLHKLAEDFLVCGPDDAASRTRLKNALQEALDILSE